MARSFYRAMLISSFVATLGSFLIDLGTAISGIAGFFGVKTQDVSEPDRGFAVLVCLMIIAFALGGLIIIQFLRHHQRD